jgi:hypothetical protein
MAWAALDPRLRAIAQEVCTDKELAAFKVRAAGASWRRGGALLDVAPETFRGACERARRKIVAECERQGLSLHELLRDL